MDFLLIKKLLALGNWLEKAFDLIFQQIREIKYNL